MNVVPITSQPQAAGILQTTAGAQKFGELLKNAVNVQALQRKDADILARQKQANLAATGLVSNALILPILKQVRRSSFNQSGPFSPGTGEKTFGPEFDMQIADRIAQSPRLAIKDALIRRLMNPASRMPVKAKEVDVNG
jgi:hypothetical protein